MEEDRPAELQQLLDKMEQLYRFARQQGETARGNLRGEAAADADETERGLFAGLQDLGRRLMREYFDSVGTGDVGYRSEFAGVEYKRAHLHRQRHILTVFGKVGYRESVYVCGNGGSVRPFEAVGSKYSSAPFREAM